MSVWKREVSACDQRASVVQRRANVVEVPEEEDSSSQFGGRCGGGETPCAYCV